MRRRYSLLVAGLFVALEVVQAQTSSIIVNADGTHTVVHHNGNTSVAINPDGTHSVIHHNGATSVMINPNGTHSVIHHNGQTSVMVNPDGTHSVITHPGNNPSTTNGYSHQSSDGMYCEDPLEISAQDFRPYKKVKRTKTRRKTERLE